MHISKTRPTEAYHLIRIRVSSEGQGNPRSRFQLTEPLLAPNMYTVMVCASKNPTKILSVMFISSIIKSKKTFG